MKQILPFSLLLFLPLFSSCSQEDYVSCIEGDDIPFIASLPGVTTRTYDVEEQFFKNGFTVTAFNPDSVVASGAILPPHFEDKTVSRELDGVFRSKECRWPGNRTRVGDLQFFAFHPSRAEMKKRAGVGNQCFILTNNTRKNTSGISYDYRLTKFRVAPDISKQVDFVTSIGEGNKTDDLYSGVELKFEHQLSGVELSAWGAATLYDIEVAGWRVGGIVLEADFSLSTVIGDTGGDGNSIGEWFINTTPLRGYVDYVFARGDKVVRINASEHNTRETAVSLLGGGGKAMVIPQKQEMWDYKNDRTSSPKGMYFSALVRITEHEGDQHCIYPSNDPESQDYIVYLSVRKSDGEVMNRLDKNGNIFGTSTKYDIPDTEELRYYGWAAAPAKVDWTAGYTYHYVLDYTNGVGVHDPYDPNPAAPIVDWGGVSVSTTTGSWGVGETIEEGGWGANSNNTAPDGTVWWK